jgi:transporter family-2 protein
MQMGAMAWAFAVGAMLSVQIGMNAALRAAFGHAALAALVNFGIGTIGLAAFAYFARAQMPGGTQIAGAPWWAWLGGLFGALYVASSTVLGPRLGAATLTALVVGGQMLSALVIDHYGLIGFAEHPVNAWRLVGAALVVVGVVLLTRA